METMNKKIKDKLEKGYKVYSKSLGRLGEIIDVNNNLTIPVLIKLRNGEKGVTSFNTGAEVKLKKQDDGSYSVLDTAIFG